MERSSDNLDNLKRLDFLFYAKLAHLEDMIELSTESGEKLLEDIKAYKIAKQ